MLQTTQAFRGQKLPSAVLVGIDLVAWVERVREYYTAQAGFWLLNAGSGK